MKQPANRKTPNLGLRISRRRGDILLSVLIFSAITVTITIGLVNWGAAMLRAIRTTATREQAFQIAEAGVDYYQWHLAQSPNDYKDGTNAAGPYVHKFFDKDGNLLGSYSLTITPPPVGSTIVTLVSVGTAASTTISRTIKEALAIPSFAKYAVVANDNMYFGPGTTVFGPVQSNGGIHFDGVAQNLVSSAKATYVDPDTGQNEYGVYTTSGNDDPQPPGIEPNRPDVFESGRQFPVPQSDFFGLTAGLLQLQGLAQSGGKEWTASNALGYHVILHTDDTYTLYKVTALQPVPSQCGTDSTATGQPQWGTWSIKTQTLYTTSGHATGIYAFPSNGVLFFDDHVWVDGQIKSARLTIVAGLIGNSDPSKNSNITINTNLLYTNYDGTDVLGIIAQGNVNIGMYSDDSFEIDGALVAENGRIGRFYYNTNCVAGTDYHVRSALTLRGMIATYLRYGFAYSDNTGYTTRNINYDGNLLYAPPPSFPQATTQYQVISWQEI